TMSEQEFDLYLSLLTKFLKLRPGQREEIADELRDHLEQRLEELTACGLTRGAAIRTALDEFGDAADLANHFRHISRIRRRRLIMRTAVGTVAALVVVLFLANAFWPNTPAAPRLVVGQQVVEKEKRAVPGVSQPELASRDAVEAKLSQRMDKVNFVDQPLTKVLSLLSDQAELDIVIDNAALSEAGVPADAPVSLVVSRTRITVRTALELVL